jgi:hypothetical protein
MGVNWVWILQKGFYEGTETCHSGLYVWYMLDFTNMRKNKKR